MDNILAFFAKLKTKKISISLDDSLENLRIRGDIKNLSPLEKQEIIENKAELISFFKSQMLAIRAIEPVEKQSSYAISDAQRRLWILSQFEGGSVAYNMPNSIKLQGKYDSVLFQRAFDSLIERHEILRTIFKADETGNVRQWILKKEDLKFKIDYKDIKRAQNKAAKVKEYIAEDEYKPFDLEKGPLLRACLLQVEDEEYVFCFNMHHLISDGWSMDVLLKDVFSYYDAYKENREPELKPLKIQYKDYSAWQLAQREEESYKAHRTYWQNNLSGELALLDLPNTKPRPGIKTNTGQGLSTYIDKAATVQLKKYSEANGGSLFMGLMAVWNVLMYRYTSQTDIIIGSLTAGREHADLEDQIGFYVNTLALRNEVKPEEDFNTFYHALKNNTLKSYTHQMYPFDRLVEELNLQRDTSRSAVFDVLLVLQNVGAKAKGDELKKDELNRIVDLGPCKSKFDIEIVFKEIGDYLSLNVAYNPDVYERDLAESLIHHYKQLLNALLENPQAKISQIDYLNQDEKDELLVTFNNTKTNYAKNKSITDLFEEQAIKTPDNTALVFKEKELTYKELDEQSNQLAAYLQKNYKVQPDDLVGIKLERSEWMIISILAVLKSGGAYVPIDPEYPQERIDYIIEDTACKVCIDENELNKFKKDQKKYATKKVNSKANANHLAYVIYTSGSTGKPKGVMIGHKSLNQFLNHALANYYTGETIIQPFVSSSAFDISVFELFLPLLTGGKSILISKEDFQDNSKFAKLLSASTAMHTVPAMYETIVRYIQTEGISKSFSGLKKIFVGGDKVSDQILKSLAEVFSSADLTVLYGPTEGTIFCTDCVYQKEKTKPGQTYQGSLIGTPNNNVSIYILNEAGALASKGVTGEICIGGDGLAKGYLNQEELIKEKFISNPFKPGEKLYKTGDSGRWTKEGSIEFIGRKDDQVKIRGYRIELGEIEHALLKHEQIESVVVLAKANEQNEKELVAYIMAKAEQNTNALRSYLKELLPEYMLPAYYVQLETLPLTSNGKVDKKALPDPQGLGLASGVEYVASRTEQEKILVLVWRDVLKREGIGIKDSFYNLGGDSIKSIQVVSRLKQQGYTLKVEQILRTPVLEELAMLMRQSTRIIDQSEVKGEVELTPVQKWFFESPEIKAYAHFNQSVLLQSKEQLDKNILEKSIGELAKHHDALRMVYKNEDGVWKQINRDATSESFTINFYDLSRADDAVKQMSQLGEELQSSINITEGPLFKVAHFRLKDGDRLGLIIHHLVVDGMSWRVLLEDLSILYTSYKENKKPELPLKTDSFQRWALLQKEYAQGNKIKKEKAYWEDLCSQEVARLPQDKKIKASDVPAIDSSLSFTLDKKITELLQTRVHGAYNTEINDVLLTGLSLAIKEVFARDKSVLKMEAHGREEIIDGVDISRTVGWFTTTYPFMLQVSETADPAASLIVVKESLREVPNKGIGYGIAKHLSQEGLNNELHPEIVFNYLGDFGTNAGGREKDSLFDYSPESIGSGIAKENVNNAVLDVSGMLVMGELILSVSYSELSYDAATIKKLIKSYEKNIKVLIKELSNKKETHLTPSDLSFKRLSIEELSMINPDNTVEDVYELSPLQEGIYYHWLSEASGSLYLEQLSYRVRAKGLNIKSLERAYDNLIARHGVLRTSFSNDYAGRSLQIVRKTVQGNFSYKKVKDKQNKKSYIEQAKLKDREKGFDLTGPSQMRLHIVDLEDGEYEFIWSHHHILMDGWCISVLISDFNKLLSGHTLDLPPVMPYSNYINWIKTVDREDSLAYWKDYLADYSEVAEIPFKIKTEAKTYAEANEYLLIEGELFKKVDTLCNQTGITQNTFIQGVWGYLLSRYNNTDDVVFGAVVSGRPAELQGVEDMIGLFINTIPVRVKYEPHMTPIELLKTLQEQSIQSTSHHYMNLSEVQSQNELGMNLIDHIIIFENYTVKELGSEGVLNTQKEESLSIESMEIFGQTNYDFNIIVSPAPTSLNINIKYNVNRYDTASLEYLKNHFNNLITVFTEYADQPLHTLNYLSEAEKHDLLVTFNDTAAEYSGNKNIMDLFAEQVAKTPDHIAIIFQENELTYRELDEQSNQLAHYLKQNYAIQPDDLIGIKLERSDWMMISILAVWKSGGAYIPIDVDYPAERLKQIITISNLSVLITDGENEDLDVAIIDLNQYRSASSDLPADALSIKINPNDLAYVIYTSGSTGQPKGVMIEHFGMLNHIDSKIKEMGIDSESRVAQNAPHTFDISVWQFFSALLVGGSTVIYDKDTILDPPSFIKALDADKITTLELVPSYFLEILSSLESEKQANCFSDLKILILNAETLTPHMVSRWFSLYPQIPIVNTYGATEASDDISHYIMYECPATLTVPVLKRPIQNFQVHIIDEQMNLVPIGVKGEILLSGPAVGRGYLNDAEQTKKSFLQGPIPGITNNNRIYKTGDLGRYLPDGTMEFFGRKDNQVKVNGHRVELGEIEYSLNRHPNVKQAVALLRNQDELSCCIVYKPSAQTENPDFKMDVWETTYDYLYKENTADSTFNVTYWIGKLDQKRIPENEAILWYEDIVNLALKGNTERILEVGCGTGNLVFMLAHQSKAYHAHDISRTSLDHIEALKSKFGDKYKHVITDQREAHDINGLQPAYYDTIILASVVQYFPSLSYLEEVITSLLTLLRPNGQLILADVNSYALHKTFTSIKELHKAGNDTSPEDLRKNIYKGIEEEKEFWIAPSYFNKLKEQVFSGNLDVSMRLERGGSSRNEINRYRYHVILKPKEEKQAISLDTLIQQKKITHQHISEVSKCLENSAEAVCITGIYNSRLRADIDLSHDLLLPENENTSAGKYKERLSVVEGIDPDELIALGERKGYQAKVFWSGTDPGCLNALYFKTGAFEDAQAESFMLNLYESQTTKGAALSNHFSESNKVIIDSIKEFLQQQLPHYMIPSSYLILEEFPLTKNGKIDRILLSKMNFETNQEIEYVAARNEIEEKLIKIWQELLQKENIGIKDDFFALGGHSLKAIRLSNEYQKELFVKLPLRDLFAHTTIESHAELIRSSKRFEFIQIEKVAPQESYPVSDAQRRLWILSQFEGGSIPYNIPIRISLEENIDIDCFKMAINATIERHEILRTVFKENEANEIRQWILEKENLGFEIDNKDFRKEENKEEKVKDYITKDSYKAFDLVNGPLLRAALLRVEEESYVFYFNMHHIISDGWSMDVLIKDVLAYYDAYKQDKQPALKPLRIQYKDYSAWQLSQVNEEAFKAHKDYWLTSLKGELPLLDLPATKQRPRIKTSNGHGLGAYIDKTTTDKLKKYSEANGGSLFMGLLAAWNVLMYRYTSQTDIITGTSIAAREHADIEDQIGFYSNTLALRNELKPEESFEAFYQSVKDTTLKSYNHQVYPFIRLAEDLDFQRDTSRSAVFDVMLFLQNNGEKVKESNLVTAKLNEEINTISDLGYIASKFDLNIGVKEVGDYLSLLVAYNPDVYDRKMVEGLINHYRQLLNALLENPGEKISEVNYLLNEEKHELLHVFNHAGIDYPKEKTIISLFEEQAIKTPGNTAVVYGNKKLSYKELDELSNRLAHYLQENYAIKPDDLVGIQLHRGEWMIVSILGILKAGGAYVPIDPEDSSSRKEHILKDASLKVLITEVNFIHDIDYYEGDVFAIDVEFEPENYSAEKLPVSNTPDHLAYVIYTSGSTGKPKGVMISSRSIVDYFFGILSKTNLSECRSFGLVSTIAADLGNTVIYASLLTGGSLHLVSKENILSVDHLLASNLDCIKMTPSHWKALQAGHSFFAPNKCLILGGEQFPAELPALLKSSGSACEVYNHYGPTETTIGKLIRHIDKTQSAFEISLGKPIGNNQVYILNAAQQLCAVGVAGEICISGDGLARGYLNQEDLTSEKFIKNLFKAGARLYRTGDLGCWTSDGNIKFIGRKDDQVKIRGYRIELGEVEHALLKHEQIEEAVVIARESHNKEKELVAYITSKAEQNTSDLRAYLKGQLPEYMLPAYYVQLQMLPITSNGKIDKKALPDPQGLVLAAKVEYVAPRNEVEQKIIEVIADILGKPKELIGVYDNFFDLGISSLGLIKLYTSINKELKLSLKVVSVFEFSNVDALTSYILNAPGENELTLEENNVSGAMDEMIDLM